MLPKDDSVNFPQLFPRVPIHPFSLPFSKLGKGTTDQKIYLRIWSTDFFIPVSPGSMTFPGGSVVKNPPADGGDAGSFHGSGRSPGEEMTTHSSILAWRGPWTGEPGGLQSITPKSRT